MLLLGLTLVAAASLAASAPAHGGKLWFGTAANVAGNVKRKYPEVTSARCFALPPALRTRFNAHSTVHRDTRSWDHLACVVVPTGSDPCVVIAHVTGREWPSFYLTSFPYRGCTPYQLR